MIIQTLIRIAFVLVGISLLTLVYFLVMYALSSYENPSNGVGDGKNKGDAPRKSTAETVKNPPMRAIIRCATVPAGADARYAAMGYTECGVQSRIFEGGAACSLGCLGLGSCARHCPNDAICIHDGSIFVSPTCTGCGRCVSVCPKGLISLIPASSRETYACVASLENEVKPRCPSAITPDNLPQSGFKILHRWSILKKKSRYE